MRKLFCLDSYFFVHLAFRTQSELDIDLNLDLLAAMFELKKKKLTKFILQKCVDVIRMDYVEIV